MENKNGLVKNKTLLRKIDTPILTTFLQLPVFIPTQKGISRDFDTYRKITVKKNEKEEIVIKGPLLDMNKDFPIWAAVLKEVDRQGTSKVVIPENELLLNIGYNKSNLNSKIKKVVESKIENMLDVSVKITFKNDDLKLGEVEDCTYFINIFATGKWDRSKKTFEFTINEDLFNAYKKITWKAIDLDYYNRIKTEYAKALFCFYESHSDYTIPIKREKLFARLGLENYSRKNNAVRKLKEAHDTLVDIGFLNNYAIEKKTDGNYYYNVNKVKKKDRVFGF